MSKKILFMSSAKLTAISIGLLLAVFCTIGMSFRPVYDEDEAAEIVMSGQRRSHWTTSGTEGSGCNSTTVTYYNDKKDYAKTESVTLGNGYTTITANSKKATPVNSNATAANSKSYVEWNSGVTEHVPNDKNKTQTDETSLVLAHTNTITFKATPMDGYYFVGWYDNSSGTGNALSTDTLWTTDVPFATATGITSYGTSQITTYENSSNPWTKTFYAKFDVIPAIDVTFIAPSTASVNRGTYTVTSEGVTTTISTTDQEVGVKGTTLTASLTDKYEFVDWYKLSGSGVKTIISTDNPCTTSFTEEVSVGIDYKELTNNHLKFTYKAVEKDEDGSYTGSYIVDGITVQANDYIYNTGDSYHYSPTLTATPASGYAFGGWYTKSGKKKTYLSYDNPWNPTFIEEGETIYANFVFNNYTDDQKAQFKVGSTTYEFRLTSQDAFEFDMKDEGRRNFWKEVAKDLLTGEIKTIPQRTAERFENGYLYPCSVANQHVFITSDYKMQGCVRASYRQFDLHTGTFDEGWAYLQQEFVDKKSTPNYKCNKCQNIRYCEHCVANFMLAYGDEEHVDPFFCQVASMRKNFVDGEIKRLLENEGQPST